MNREQLEERAGAKPYAHEKQRLRVVPSRLVSRRLAVVDDDEAIQFYLTDTLGQLGFTVSRFDSAEAFLQNLKESGDEDRFKDPLAFPFDVILCDVRLPGKDGLSLVQSLKALAPDVPIVLMTAYAQLETAVLAIKEGAYDYLEKPFDLSRLTLVIENALQVRALDLENKFLKSSGAVALKLEGVVCQSPAMFAVYDLVKRVAPQDLSVTITGESGTGKEAIARALYENGNRTDRPFTVINCTAVQAFQLSPEVLIKSKGGTVFLDEVGDLDLSLQGDLVRELQNSKLDIRFVSASNKDLLFETKVGRFREDLFYRLSLISIHIPPLRQRKEDILPLARYFLTETIRKNGLRPMTFSQSALSVLAQLPWKGNLRELKNIIESAALLVKGNEIDSSDLPVIEKPDLMEFISDLSGEFPSLKDIETSYLHSVLRKVNGKKDVAAKVLGMSRRTLYRKLTKTDAEDSQI